MESKNSFPKYIIVIALIVVVALIFFFLVQLPFMSKQPELEKQHQADASQLKIYQDAYADRENLAARVSSMKAQYEKDSKDLFINATKSPQDIMDMINASKVMPTTYSVSEQTIDSKGRQSSSGEPLYSTNISIVFNSLDETQIGTVLDYFEAQSEGAYYIGNVSLSALAKEDKPTAAEDVDNSEDSKSNKDESSESNDKVNGDLNTLYFSGKYQVSITLMLYYFLPTDQTPDAIRKAVEEASNAAEGKVVATTSDASSASSAA
ncbi:hypothetical protein [Candidatus Pseudoruminococcus sp.]|uniref:hypothetical protein n=1 Tax=Candidatus Pseudoruminococcus sp. TaxID=3101048 RepID=UPI00399A596E